MTQQSGTLWIERLRPGTWMMVMGALIALAGIAALAAGGNAVILFLGLLIAGIGFARRLLAAVERK